MTDIVRVIRKLEYLKLHLLDIILESLDEHEVQIKELIHVQLRKGTKGDGQLITPQYSNKYAAKKGRTVPDLKVDGSYWDSIFTEPDNDVLLIKSEMKTRKGFELAEHLEERYTSKILELDAQSLQKLGKIILPSLKKRINEIN